MKRTKREENGIIVSFLLFLFLVIGIAVFIIVYVLGNIQEIENMKKTTKENYDNYVRIIKSGQTFDDMKKNVKQYLKTHQSNKTYIDGIINKMDQSFYTKHLTSTGAVYMEFLEKKEREYGVGGEEKNEKKLNSAEEEMVERILPVYSVSMKGIPGADANLLTDFKFINYIEKLMKAFNLDYKTSLGINSVNLEQEYVIGTGDQTLEKNIFYIPMSFEISGKKKDILDFIYFAENVGKISKIKKVDPNKKDDKGKATGEKACLYPSEKQDTLSIIKSEKSDTNCFTVNEDFETVVSRFRLADSRNNRNVFNNQIIEIASISFPEYIDNTEESKKDSDTFVSFIKKEQGTDFYAVQMELKFYVQGFPGYKIKQFVTDVDLQYKNMKIVLKRFEKNTKYTVVEQAQFTEMLTNLEKMTKDVAKLKQLLSGKKQDLLSAHREAYQYYFLMQNYATKIKEIVRKNSSENKQKENKDIYKEKIKQIFVGKNLDALDMTEQQKKDYMSLEKKEKKEYDENSKKGYSKYFGYLLYFASEEEKKDIEEEKMKIGSTQLTVDETVNKDKNTTKK